MAKEKMTKEKLWKNIKAIWNESTEHINKIDVLIICIICLVYGVFSFINLGNTKSPQTFFVTEGARFEASLELETKIHISKIRYFDGPQEGKYEIWISTDNKKFEQLTDINLDYNDVLKWHDYTIDKDVQYIRITSLTSGAILGDVQFYDANNNPVVAKASDIPSEVLVDESSLTPKEITYMNSAYFDEIYFPKTAYQYIHNIKAYECVHPPLGKLIQALPIVLMGFTPFAWRFAGNVCGILLIAVMYIFGKNLFKKRKWGIVAALLMVFDNFHFAQSRMGTVDTELVLFMLLSVMFMYQYMMMDKKTSLGKRLLKLALSGIFAGCAITTKWSGGSCCALIALMFFYDLIKKNFGKDNKWTKDTTIIIISCFVFFLIIPFTIYAFSYFLFPNVTPYYVTNISTLFQEIQHIFNYHSRLTAGHPYSSNWYTWPIMLRPVWYYNHVFDNKTYATISGIGNIAIWWSACLAVIYMIIKLFRKRDMTQILLLIAIMCMWLPYIFIGRCMFLYHFFPTLPYMIFTLIYVLRDICKKVKSDIPIFIYLGIVFIFFWIFYPIVSGIKSSSIYIRCLEWLKTWSW